MFSVLPRTLRGLLSGSTTLHEARNTPSRCRRLPDPLSEHRDVWFTSGFSASINSFSQLRAMPSADQSRTKLLIAGESSGPGRSTLDQRAARAPDDSLRRWIGTAYRTLGPCVDPRLGPPLLCGSLQRPRLRWRLWPSSRYPGDGHCGPRLIAFEHYPNRTEIQIGAMMSAYASGSIRWRPSSSSDTASPMRVRANAVAAGSRSGETTPAA